MKTKQIILAVLSLLAFSSVAGAEGSSNNENPDGLFLKKTVSEDPSMPNKYSLNLEAFVTGVKVPAGAVDILFILDTSTSMSDNEKLTNLKKSVISFLDVLKAGDSRVSIVTFGNTASTITDFVSIKDNYETLKAQVNGLSLAGATKIDLGMEAGLNLIKNNKSDRMKYCIVLTDGVPGSSTNPSYSVAEKAWQFAYSMKHDYDVTVYSLFLGTAEKDIKMTYSYQMDAFKFEISVLGFLDGTSSNIPEAYWYVSKGSYNDQKWTKYNKSRQTSVSSTTQASKEETKYMKDVSDPAELEQIFKDIAAEISKAALPLSGEATEVIDIVSDSFKLPDIAFNPDGTLKSDFIKLFAVKCTGTRAIGTGGEFEYVFDDANPIALPTSSISGTDFDKVQVLPQDDNKKKITVTGFDFQKNFVAVPSGQPAQGYKLVIKFDIVIDPAFPGGASAATNTEGSGIYFDEDGTGMKQIGWFPSPSVKVPNIAVVKYGLKKGESAIFNVYRIDETSGDRSALPLMLVATQSEGKDYAIAKVKLQKPGRYEVEETAWSWAYTISSCQSTYDKDDKNVSEKEWNEKGYGPSPDYLFPIPTVTGTTTTANSITRNVNDFTEEDSVTYDYKGTFYIFTNEAKTGTPAHAEANKNNEFFELK